MSHTKRIALLVTAAALFLTSTACQLGSLPLSTHGDPGPAHETGDNALPADGHTYNRPRSDHHPGCHDDAPSHTHADYAAHVNTAADANAFARIVQRAGQSPVRCGHAGP